MKQTKGSFIITLIRHGETYENDQGIIQGQNDTKLNELGRQQAVQLSKSFPILEYNPNLVYSSDLSRAYDTCKILLDANETSQAWQIITDVLLRERSFGPVQGKTSAYLHQLAREAGVPVTKFTPDGGETPEDVRQRVIDFVQNRLLKDVHSQDGTDGHSKVLLVCHGGVIREMISYFATFGHESLQTKKSRLIPPNTSVNDFKVSYKVDPSQDESGQASYRIAAVECTRLHDISHLSDEVQNKALNQPQINDNISI